MQGIAIVGMAGRFPGAPDVDAFWRNLTEGVESVTRFSRETMLENGFDPDEPAFVAARGVLDRVDRFDPAFFGLSPREAEIMDPQQRLFLQAAWHALEHAACPPCPERSVGVFAGCSMNTYLLHNLCGDRAAIEELTRAFQVGEYPMLVGNDKDYLATRVAHRLDLRGPAITIQTACSTSLVAVVQACQSLLAFGCDVALAGGVSASFPQERGWVHQEGHLASADGHCRPFDADANGTVFGAGVGVVVLKRLDEAIADGDTIYAVIKGTAINNDGAAKQSFLAPSPDGQAEVVAMAQAMADFPAESIGYVEAHGTGTPLGDPIEIAGLNAAFGTERRQYCALGSVKGNVGHLEAAAGVTGLIKTALALYHETIPPTLHFRRPNPRIDLARSPFRVVDRPEAWPRSEQPRRAGVSAFGVGGTNAHVVLEEAPPAPASGPSRKRQLLLVSARSETALAATSERLAGALAGASLADAAFTLSTGRAHLERRRFVVASSPAEAEGRLKAGDEGRVAGTPALAFMFPGQGAQRPGMGRELYEQETLFRAEVDRCAAILEPSLGFDIRDAIFGDDAARLTATAVTQPALFVIEYALARLWMSWGIVPAAMIGHSVGEYVAATISGVLSLEDALGLIALRGRLMQQLPPGGMVAARISEREIAPLLNGRLSLAAVNGVASCVVSGPHDALERLRDDLARREVSARLLATSHAFHSAMMEPLEETFTEAVRRVERRAPRIPYLSNVTGRWIGAEDVADAGYWYRHLRRAVRFSDGLAELCAEPRRLLLEVGPGQTLAMLARQHPARQAGQAALPGGADEESLLQALGAVWAAGAAVDFEAFWKGEARRKIALPGYAFDEVRCWVEPPRASAGAARPEALRVEAGGAEETAPPEDDRVASIKALLHEVSGLDLGGASPDASFYELGFDSLLLTQAAVRLKKRFGVAISFRELMQEVDTIRKVAGRIGAGAPAAKAESASSMAAPIARTQAHHGPFKPIQKNAGERLTPEQSAALARLVERYNARTRTSKQMAAEHRAHYCDPRNAGGFRQVWKEMVYPIVAERSQGARIWDVDGNEYVDVTMGFGANFLGHNPPFVTEAVLEQLGRGVEIGPQHRLAGEVAKGIARMTGLPRVTFCNTGSEAVMAAIRVARTVTGRDRFVMFGGDYHGIFDEVLIRPVEVDGELRSMPIAPGIPSENLRNVVVLPYGEDASLEWIRAHADEIAAVVVEPVQARHPSVQPRGFLQALREVTREGGTALVFDEVITGFRCHPGGAQAWYGVQADMATYGKIIGGGMPIGVLAGSAQFMDALDGGAWQFGDDSFPEVGVTFFAGTFVRHPLAIAAAHAVLRHLEKEGPELQERTARRAARFASEVNAMLARRGVPARLQSFSSVFYLAFDGDLPYAPLLFYYLRDRGVHVWEGRVGFISTEHSEGDIDFLVGAFEGAVSEMQAAGFLPRPARQEALPLTRAQREVWLAARMGEAASAAFNESCSVRLRGALDVAALSAAAQQLVDGHEALRAVFSADGREQRLLPTLSVEMPYLDLTDLDEAAREVEVRELLENEGIVPFDLERGPVVRFQLVKRAEDDHLLVVTAHHLACDGWSFDVLLTELGATYAALAAGREAPPFERMQLSEYARWEAEQDGSAERWWLEKLAGTLPVLDLPREHARPSRRSFRGARRTRTLPADLVAEIRALSLNTRVTPFALLLGAYATLLHRLSGQSELIVGFPVAGQVSAGAESLIGHCANLLPLRVSADPEAPFERFASAVAGAVLEACEHRDFTFGALLEKLELPRDPSRVPLVSTIFNIDPPMSRLGWGKLSFDLMVNPRSFYQFDLGFNLVDEGATIEVGCDYATDLWSGDTIDQWMGCYETLLRGIVEAPHTLLGRLPLLGEEERRVALEGRVCEPIAMEARRTLHGWFEEVAQGQPWAVAVSCGAERLTYGDLAARSNQLAHELIARGARPGQRIGLLLERSVELPVAMLAVLKAGCSYVPIDPVYPRERIGFILEDAEIHLILTQTSLRLEGVDAICLDASWPAIGRREESAPAVAVKPDDDAYVIYTSGSTGRPKGARITHHNVARLFEASEDIFAFDGEDVWTMFHSPAFDFSVWEIWGALLYGGRLVIVPYTVSRSPDAMYALLIEERVTVLNQTPSAFRALVGVDATHAQDLDLRLVIFGGEALDFTMLAPWLERHGDDRPALYNCYGITETTVHVTWRRLRRDDALETRSLIGRPLPDLEMYVLDPYGQPVPPLVAGELWVAGGGVGRGYLNRDDLTRAKFVAHPVLGRRGLAYRSGDRVRWLPDGECEYLGRIDHQVKIRGFRIELGEIENALCEHPGVAQSVVMARADRHGEKRLVAWYVSTGAAPVAEELRAWLLRTLPEYMVPAYLLPVERMPLTNNGKIDRAALPEPLWSRPDAARAYTRPRNEVEERMARLWEQVLEVERVGVHDDFFALGGHSMLAVELFGGIEKTFGKNLPLATLFSAPTVAQLCETLERSSACGRRSTLVEIQPDGARPPFVWLHTLGGGGGGGLLRYRSLAAMLGADQPSFGLEAPEEPFHRIEDMAGHYIEVLRTLQPHGPYHLGGYCFGGVVAYEMAVQLRALGEEIATLAIIETEVPGYAERAHDFSASSAIELLSNLSGRLGEVLTRKPQEHLAQLARKGVRKLIGGRLAAAEPERALPRLEDYVDMTRYPADYRRYAQTHWEALLAYRPRPYEGRITLFRVKRQPLHITDRALGWGDVAGEVAVHICPGTHENILEEPHVRTLAMLLRGELAGPGLRRVS
jgi:amino acid adenylation domain-containing protein